MGWQAGNLQTTIISYIFGLTIFVRSIAHQALTPLVQGPSWQSVYFKLPLMDRNVQVRFCLKVSVYS